MRGTRNYLRLAGAVFQIVALAHLVRAIAGWPVTIGDVEVANMVSWVGFVVAQSLALMAFRHAQRSGV